MSVHVCECRPGHKKEWHLRYPGFTEREAQLLADEINGGWLRNPLAPAVWRSIEFHGPPPPELFVLCWNGKETFVEWFGSKPDAGRGVTHWIPYEMPPGSTSDMHDGLRVLIDG